MFFDFVADEASTLDTIQVRTRRKPEAKTVTVPAQQWAQWSTICCAMKMAEAKSGEVPSVPSLELGGYLHVVFSVMYGGLSGLYQADAWQIVPVGLYDGQTWNHVSGHEFDETVRERGDYTGMLVSVRGTQMVCSKPVSVIRSLPTVRPIPPDEAMAYDEKARCYGWRALHYQGAKIGWKMLQGHPVVVYQMPDEERRMAVLLWKHEGHIEDYYLGASLDTSNLPDMPATPAWPSQIEPRYTQQVQQPSQVALF